MSTTQGSKEKVGAFEFVRKNPKKRDAEEELVVDQKKKLRSAGKIEEETPAEVPKTKIKEAEKPAAASKGKGKGKETQKEAEEPAKQPAIQTSPTGKGQKATEEASNPVGKQQKTPKSAKKKSESAVKESVEETKSGEEGEVESAESSEGSQGNKRRPSLSQRGKRQSISNGSANLHYSVEPHNLHRHVSLDLPAHLRLKQILLWVLQRELEELKKNVSPESEKIAAICSNLVAGLKADTISTSWDSATKDVQRPNTRNLEMKETIKQYQEQLAELQAEEKTWNTLFKKGQNRSKVELDLRKPFDGANPPPFLLQKDLDLLASSFGNRDAEPTNFDVKKLKEGVTLDIDQLHHIVSAFKRATETIGEGCENAMKRLNEISFEGYPNRKHPELLMGSIKEGKEE